jgi:hypothetical protein
MPAAQWYNSIFILVYLTASIEAWPTGAGHCDSKVPTSFKSSHGSTGSGGLESGDVTLSSTSGTSTESSNLNELGTLDVGTEYTLTIENAGGEPYKGFLVRVSDKSGADVSGLVRTKTDDAQILSLCESNVAGITHTDNDLKSGVSMTLQLNAPAQLLVEVTVVTANNVNVTDAYYYSEYEFTVRDSNPKSSAPSSEPAISPGSFFATIMLFSFTLSVLSCTLLL